VKIVLGADHAGFPLKGEVASFIAAEGHQVLDAGTWSEKPVDFPDIVSGVCAMMASTSADRGVLVCGTGIGASIAANKIPGIRAALAHDIYSAHQAVEHDNANVLCLGAQIIGAAVAHELVHAFLAARWDQAEEFVRRVGKITELERGRAAPQGG
jgi:ribose 5-phosphate isomerase B